MSGAGRGRGWLNLVKNQPPARPGGLTYPLTSPASPVSDNRFTDVSQQHNELINRVQTLDLNDDGILFNQKIKHILGHWKSEYTNQDSVDASFNSLFNASLQNAELGSKLVLMVASSTFIKQEVNEKNIRKMFIHRLQDAFESAKQLQTQQPLLFRNFVRMIGEFYNKVRLPTGQPYKFLLEPILYCLEMLLDSKSVLDYSEFTKQIYLNGATVKTRSPENLESLMTKIRTLILDSTNPKDCKIWLLLTLELYNNKFGILPCETYKFYEDQLGMVEMAHFQRSHDILSVQTVNPSPILDSYKSNVNVLQISTQQETSSEPPANIYNNAKTTTATTPPDFNVGKTNENHPKKQHNSKERKEKTGRPILGAGARFSKNHTEIDSSTSSSTWKDPRENSTGWKSKQQENTSGSGWWGESKKDPPSLKSNKGWEHDDRFDTDYS